MDIFSAVLPVVALVLVVYIITIYNRLVSLKHNVKKAWGNIDVLLKQRHDELPKLIATCKAYMKHERETLERVAAARGSVATARQASDIKALGVAETSLRAGLGQLFAVVENYPDLKADNSFQHVQSRITGLENAIADRREFYNESVNVNNIRREVIPDVFIARLFSFSAFDLLEFQEQELADMDVAALFTAS